MQFFAFDREDTTLDRSQAPFPQNQNNITILWYFYGL